MAPFPFCFPSLASLISTLYHGTSGRDLMVLVITGACAWRVLDNVVFYKLTSSLRFSGLCWHTADFCRSFLNDSMSMLLVFLYDISLIVSDGFLIIKSLITVKWSENRQSAIELVGNRLSAHLVIITSRVWPDLWVGTSTRCCKPMDSSNPKKRTQSVSRGSTTWMLKSPVINKSSDDIITDSN